MALAVKAPHLNSDGKAHPRENALALTCLALGVISFVMAWTGTQTSWGFHIAGVAIGVVGFALAIWAQMVSATTGERWTIVPGWILSALGVGLGLAFAANM